MLDEKELLERISTLESIVIVLYSKNVELNQELLKIKNILFNLTSKDLSESENVKTCVNCNHEIDKLNIKSLDLLNIDKIKDKLLKISKEFTNKSDIKENVSLSDEFTPKFSSEDDDFSFEDLMPKNVSVSNIFDDSVASSISGYPSVVRVLSDIPDQDLYIIKDFLSCLRQVRKRTFTERQLLKVVTFLKRSYTGFIEIENFVFKINVDEWRDSLKYIIIPLIEEKKIENIIYYLKVMRSVIEKQREGKITIKECVKNVDRNVASKDEFDFKNASYQEDIRL